MTNEVDRKLKIKCIERTMDEEKNRRSKTAIMSAILFVSVFVTTKVSGFDTQKAIEAEIKALNSWKSLKEYFSMFTPAMVASISASVISFKSFLNHRRRYNNAVQQYSDMMEIQTENFEEDIELNNKIR